MANNPQSKDDMILKEVLYTQAKVEALIEAIAKIRSHQTGEQWGDLAKHIDRRSKEILAEHISTP
jgi:hypothetical protein